MEEDIENIDAYLNVQENQSTVSGEFLRVPYIESGQKSKQRNTRKNSAVDSNNNNNTGSFVNSLKEKLDEYKDRAYLEYFNSKEWLSKNSPIVTGGKQKSNFHIKNPNFKQHLISLI